jgi:hypothetical protein
MKKKKDEESNFFMSLYDEYKDNKMGYGSLMEESQYINNISVENLDYNCNYEKLTLKEQNNNNKDTIKDEKTKPFTSNIIEYSEPININSETSFNVFSLTDKNEIDNFSVYNKKIKLIDYKEAYSLQKINKSEIKIKNINYDEYIKNREEQDKMFGFK